ncbi:MAG: flavin reductase [Bacteroidales bacterium]|nr:flavin reductase [Bacteroidales bacterium]
MRSINENFQKQDSLKISDNIFQLIGNDWMLITAGTPESFNTMTASWGTMGVLWNKKVAIIFIRPQRYTHKFVERNDNFTLSFFEDKFRNILQICGAKSGRDIDKIKATGLIPVITDNGNIAYKQSRLVFECKKIYANDLNPESFVYKTIIDKNYPDNDFHRMYIGEIINCYIKQ